MELQREKAFKLIHAVAFLSCMLLFTRSLCVPEEELTDLTLAFQVS